jgi:IS30 family transposase
MMAWTEEMDTILRDGHQRGLSARIIAEQIGTTRNSILGRTFRLGLCQSYTAPRRPTVTAPHPKKEKHNTLLRVAIRKEVHPDQLVERLKDLIDLDLTWKEIAADLGVNTLTARGWAVRYAGYVPRKLRKFTEEDRQYISDAWNRNVLVEDIADKLGRSWGVVHQEIFRMQKLGAIGGRDAAKTRLLHQYGEAALAAGNTPAEALKKMQEAKQAAFAAAIRASNDAKQKFRNRAIADMRERLAAGEDRNACIFAARAEGVTLEMIAAEFDITRERVRQICNAYATTIAIKTITEHVA